MVKKITLEFDFKQPINRREAKRISDLLLEGFISQAEFKGNLNYSESFEYEVKDK